MLKVAVIGTGSMGKNHVRVYSELAEAKITSVCDQDMRTVNALADRYGIKGYTDYNELLEKERPEAVSIVVPTVLHEEIALAAMQAGAHVLIEKPIANTIEAAKRLIESSKELNKVLMVGHIVRFNPAIQALKKRLEAGELGRIFQIVCRRVGPFPSRIRDVGVVIDLGTHDLDLMRYIIGVTPIRIYAETQQRIHTAHEDLLLALLKFPNDVSGSLEINWLTPTKAREVLVLGERGLFKVDDLTQDLYFYENGEANGELWPALETLKGVSEGCLIRYALQRYEPLKAELRAFLRSIIEGSPAPVSGYDGFMALKLALAVAESGGTHQSVEVIDVY